MKAVSRCAYGGSELGENERRGRRGALRQFSTSTRLCSSPTRCKLSMESRQAAFDGSIPRQGPKKKGPQKRGYWDIASRVSRTGSEASPSLRRRRLVVSRPGGRALFPPIQPLRLLGSPFWSGKPTWPTRQNWGPVSSAAHDATRHDISRYLLRTAPRAAAHCVNCTVPAMFACFAAGDGPGGYWGPAMPDRPGQAG